MKRFFGISSCFLTTSSFLHEIKFLFMFMCSYLNWLVGLLWKLWKFGSLYSIIVVDLPNCTKTRRNYHHISNTYILIYLTRYRFFYFIDIYFYPSFFFISFIIISIYLFKAEPHAFTINVYYLFIVFFLGYFVFFNVFHIIIFMVKIGTNINKFFVFKIYT